MKLSMVDLEYVADVLDSFPEWDEHMRAEVYHAIDVAPDDVILDGDELEDYFRSEAHAAWDRIRFYILDYGTEKRWAVTLLEASGGEASPTKDEIVKSLERGVRLVR